MCQLLVDMITSDLYLSDRERKKVIFGRKDVSFLSEIEKPESTSEEVCKLRSVNSFPE